MIAKGLTLAAVVKLAAAYSVAIPTITKDLDGTQIDIDVQVDIDTGDESPVKPPGFEKGLFTKKIVREIWGSYDHA